MSDTFVNRIRIEPQPELIFNSGGAWMYDGNVYMSRSEMESYLFNDVYGNEIGNSTVFTECYPVLIDSVWYWQE